MAEAQAAVAREVPLPPGVAARMDRAVPALRARARGSSGSCRRRSSLVALLLYANTRSGVETAIVLLAVPFSLIGAVWLLFALDYHLSVAVWVGLIALAGLDAQTGVVMLLYLTLAHRGAPPRAACAAPRTSRTRSSRARRAASAPSS